MSKKKPAMGFAPMMPNGSGSAGRLLNYSDTLAGFFFKLNLISIKYRNRLFSFIFY